MVQHDAEVCNNRILWYGWNTVLYLHKFSTAWILLFLPKEGSVGEW